MENLLLFLDPASIICLAKAHKPVLDIVLGKTVWNKLIKKTIKKKVCRQVTRDQVAYISQSTFIVLKTLGW